MASGLVSGVMKPVVTKLLNLLEEKWKLAKNVQDEIRYIINELNMLNGVLQDLSRMEDHNETTKSWIKLVRELTYDIEDSIDQFTHSVGLNGKKWWLCEAKKSYPIAVEVQKLKRRVEQAAEQQRTYRTDGTLTRPVSPVTYPIDVPPVNVAEIDGIIARNREIIDLLALAEDAQQNLRVISIVGSGGTGKTALAMAVYRTTVYQNFQCRSSFRVSPTPNEKEILKYILRQVRQNDFTGMQGWESWDVRQLRENLSLYLQDKKYFIVIDDIWTTEAWDSIKTAFPNNDKRSRIIVTTTIQSIADTCCRNCGSVYQMRTLDRDASRTLFLRKVFGFEDDCPPGRRGAPENILKKCDGLPLALVTMAKSCSRTDFTTTKCEEVCNNLGSILESDDDPNGMKKTLARSYNSLPHDVKTCLQSLSIFPEGHKIKRKSLIRRWLAEGFVEEVARPKEEVAGEYFAKLIDRNIIQPMDISNNTAVKTCRVYSLMLAFVVYKSIHENFVTLVRGDQIISGQAENVRRLFFHSSSSMREIGTNLSHVRSLTVFGDVRQARLVSRECKLLRVLDLENCRELENDHLLDICNLLQLKYLSIRGTDISKLPRKIKKLQYLETLDIRETKVDVLQKEVIQLPRLAHLFGKFQLPYQTSKIKGVSPLQTLAGFYIDGNEGFVPMVGDMTKLRKISIWCKSTPIRNLITDHLSPSLRKLSGQALRSLSINSSGCSLDFMHSMAHAPFGLHSLKLHGELNHLPTFITSLENLQELSLSCTRISMHGLSLLKGLPALRYLKLSEDHPTWIGQGIVLKRDEFQSLRRLCFILAVAMLPLLTFEQGAVPELSSLQLFCHDMQLPCGIEHLQNLEEISIDSRLSQAKKEALRKAANEHPKRPKIISCGVLPPNS